jgi:hypothetical protein
MCERDSSQAQLMGKDQEASVTMIPGVPKVQGNWVHEEHMGALHMEVGHRIARSWKWNWSVTRVPEVVPEVVQEVEYIPDAYTWLNV